MQLNYVHNLTVLAFRKTELWYHQLQRLIFYWKHVSDV